MKLLIADDHPLIREGVAAVLAPLDQPADPLQVLHAADGPQCLALADAHPDLAAVLLDLRLGEMAGLVVLAQLRERHPGVAVLVLSSSEDPADVRRALASGARGYCPKSAPPGSLVAALRLVLAGELYVPPLMLHAGDPALAAHRQTGLTERQVQVLELLCDGQSNKEIARALGLEERTVKGHVSAIFRALNVVHRLQAIDAARAAGLVGSR